MPATKEPVPSRASGCKIGNDPVAFKRSINVWCNPFSMILCGKRIGNLNPAVAGLPSIGANNKLLLLKINVFLSSNGASVCAPVRSVEDTVRATVGIREPLLSRLFNNIRGGNPLNLEVMLVLYTFLTHQMPMNLCQMATYDM